MASAIGRICGGLLRRVSLAYYVTHTVLWLNMQCGLASPTDMRRVTTKGFLIVLNAYSAKVLKQMSIRDTRP